MNPPIRSAADLSFVTQGEQRAILIVTCSAAFLFFNSFGSIGVALWSIRNIYVHAWSPMTGVDVKAAAIIALPAILLPLVFWLGRLLSPQAT